MLDEQLAVVEERVRETNNTDLLSDAANALAQLFSAARNWWGAMSKEDRLHVEKIIATLSVNFSMAEAERAQAGGLADA
eukprot:5362550-Alexandrium_andersonii.AAC.1